MSDIVKRLEIAAQHDTPHDALMSEASDEIERLRGEVLHLKHDISLVKSMLPPGYKYESFTVGMGLKND
jgi:hypothetical protein